MCFAAGGLTTMLQVLEGGGFHRTEACESLPRRRFFLNHLPVSLLFRCLVKEWYKALYCVSIVEASRPRMTPAVLYGD